jgi:UDP-N-acetylmuramoyl-L-alanyl-D-glutamate--2,6-diaminopimelate ligase
MSAKPTHLSTLIAGIPGAVLHGDKNVIINAIRYDSRLVQNGDLFVAIKGYTTDGHRYINQAVANGAAAVIHERPLDQSLKVTTVQVPSSRKALAVVSACFYNYPQRDLKLIGVTGTNGKTTITHMLWSIFQTAMPPAGMIGTIENRVGTEPLPAIHTTPESLDLQELFDRMRRERLKVASMEVSSHALALDRVFGLDFSAAVFTNLSHEHLDFHHTLEEYRDAKAVLFMNLSQSATAILNEDDRIGKYYRSITPAKVWMYSLKDAEADLYGHDVESDWSGTRLTARTPQGIIDFETTLAGWFNASNLLAAVGAAMALDISANDIREGLATLESVPGRFERVPVDVPFTVIVDYAHTPDALDNCLRAARVLPGRRLITVFGCGGDRDRKKRPLMGKIAQDLSDVAVITSDNPRTEDPELIIEDIIAGLDRSRPVFVEVDRRKAIAKALAEAHPGDVVVVAGKGHETYQIIQDRKEPFDDRQVIAECL